MNSISKDQSDSQDLLRELFGDPIYSYGDDQAVADGILVPFVAERKDTRHRITRNAFETLKQHYRGHGYEKYSDLEFHNFFLAELLPLAPFAVREYEAGGVFKTTYDFKVTKANRDVLWYLPNEVRGVTVMLPEDY